MREVSLNDNYSHRNVIKITRDMLSIFINKNEDYIPIKHYIKFLKEIPSVFWAEYPVMYYRDNKWDALGFLGERLGKSTVITKYLELCFKSCKLKITECLDNEDDIFKNIIDNKHRFIKYLYYIEGKLNKETMKKLYSQSKLLSDERNYFK